MSEFSDEQLVDFVLGLGTDHGLEDAVRTEPELRHRCNALKTELCHLDEELAELLDHDRDGILTKASWRILLAVDGSSGSRKAALAALALALRGEGVVEVLHVCELGQPGGWVGPLPGETRAEAAALIGPILGELRGRGVMARGQLRSAPAGHVARSILWEAEEIAADIIVMGPSNPSRLSALLAPRVAAAVVRKARRPVLVVF
jgi:nucleotide-binding universal stress UspA family protein